MFTVNRRALLESVSEAKRFADPKSTMPILACVMLAFSEGRLSLAATDLNQTFLDCIETAQSAEQPAIAACVDARKLVEVLKVLPGEDLQIDLQETVLNSETITWNGRAGAFKTCTKCSEKERDDLAQCRKTKAKGLGREPMLCGGDLLEKKIEESRRTSATFLAGRGKFKLNSLSARDFPRLPIVDGLAWQTLSAQVLRELVDGTLDAISRDETREHLNGALIETQSGRVRMVATDGHRLVHLERLSPAFSLDGKNKSTILVPRVGVVEMRKHCGKDVDVVELAVSKGSLFLRERGGTAIYVEKLAQAQFPPYEQVIPRHTDRFAVVPRKALIESLGRLAVVASPTTQGIRWRWTSQGNSAPVALSLETDNPDVGDASEEISGTGEGLSVLETLSKSQRADGVEPKRLPFVIGINGKYAVEALSKIASDDVFVGMNGELDPVVFKADRSGTDVYVVMPMRL